MGFKLPHDVVFTFAKRDEPPSRRRPVNSFRIAYDLWPVAHSLARYPLREADSDRRAAGSRWNSFIIGFRNLKTKSFGDCRLLRGGNLCNLCDLWFD